MIPDEQFRRTFDLLAERCVEELNTQLKKIGDELGGAYLAGRDKAVADASITARTEAERMIAEKIAAAEQVAQEGVAAADARAREQIAAAEQRSRDAIAAAEQKAREDVAAAETRAHEAVNRAESLVQEAMTSAETRTRESVAAAEAQSRHLASAAEARALEAVAAVEARAKQDLDTAVSRLRGEASADTLASSERLLAAVRTIDAGQSLSDIMNSLLRAACLEAKRVAIFVRDGERLRSWKLIGFDAALEQDGSMTLALSDAGIVSTALQSGQTMMSGAQSSEFAPTFAALPPDRTALAFPIVISREVIGVLYADPDVDGDERSTWAATVEVLGRHAARALEVLTASKLLAQAMAARQSAPAPASTGAASAPPRFTLGLR